jgi:hypothetical protein
MYENPVIGTPNIDAATPEQLRQEITDLSVLAQRAENAGDRVLAGACHNLINAGLDHLAK